jgi:hypothetical protein
MSEAVGNLYYEVTLQTEQLLNEARKVEARLERLAQQGPKTQLSLTKMAAAISAALSAIAVNELVSKIVTAQRQFDVMFASLKTMTGGADQAGLAFDRLRKFAEGTPYTLKQSVDGFVKLKALGLDPSERSMTSFGNTASAMGKDLMQMIEAVADASTGEFERLKEFGIKAKVEGDKVALTFQGVTTKIANNAKSITEYLVKIGETNFAGAMAERMNTLDGYISNLEDSLQALFLTVSQSGFGDAIAVGVRKATEAIAELTTSVKNGELTDYFDKLKPFVTAAEVAVVSLAGAVAGRLIASFVAAAAQAYTTATAIGAATLAARGFTGVLTLMGGPIGIAVTGLALLALNWDKVGAEARDAATMSEDAAKRIATALKKTPAAATKALGTQMGEVKGEIAAIEKELARTTFPKADPGQLKELEERRRTLVQIQKEIQTAMNGVGAGGGRGSVNPDFVKPDEPKAETRDTKVKTPKFDSSRYLAGLAAQVASEWDRIGIIEDEKIREAGEHLKKKEITEREHQEAVNLIRADGAKDRAALMDREFKEAVADGERRYDAMKAQEEKMAADKKALQATRDSTVMTTLQVRAESGGVEDKVALIQAQAAAELAATEAARVLDLEANQIYADKKVAIEEDMNRRVAETRAAANQAALTSTSEAFGSIANVLRRAEGEQSGIYEVMFAAQKAFSIASSIVAIQTGIANAAALPFPANLLAMASVVSATASIVSTISGASYGGARQYGGPTQAGSLYKVNETGAPEMFTGSNGSQYMLSGQGGNVTPADQVGGGGLVYSPTINIDGTADRAAITVQVQRAIANSQKDFMEQMKRMKVIPQ